MRSILKGAAASLLLGFAASVSMSQTHMTPAQVQADIARYGPYAERPFARKMVTSSTASLAAPMTALPGRYQVENTSGHSNELIVLINHDRPDGVKQLFPEGITLASAPAVEREVVKAISARGLNAQYVLGNPIGARFLIHGDRFRDSERTVSAQRSGPTGGLDVNPRELLDRYIVVRYETPDLAKAAAKTMKSHPAFSYVQNNGPVTFSAVPTDVYFSQSLFGSPPEHYQWGMTKMNFPDAWNNATGQAYVGIVDADFPGIATPSALSIHPDLQRNFRQHMLSRALDTSGTQRNHTVHVAGIIAAEHGNGASDQTKGVAGACPECSFVTYPASLASDEAIYNSNPTAAFGVLAEQITAAVDSGMQLINWSGNARNYDCTTAAPICNALYHAWRKGVLVMISAGNYNVQNAADFAATTHDGSVQGYSVLPVGGISENGLRWSFGGTAPESGANGATNKGVVGPALDVVSTFNQSEINPTYWLPQNSRCADVSPADQSAGRFPGSGYGDKIGSCTGTSMAAPHITGLAALVLSVNPRLTANDVRNIIRGSGDKSSSVSDEYGYGLPSALTAVNNAILGNPTKLTPLFSYFSSSRNDSFYTTAPQMARSAALGRLYPRKPGSQYWENSYSYSDYGTWITGYSLPENGGSWGGDTSTYVKAQVWIFTTPSNPKSTLTPLRPIYRMSYACPISGWMPAACTATNGLHVDTVLVDQAEISYFQWIGYKVDGLEGYVYPKELAQPPGTVKLMRKYNQDLDDHAVFPDPETANMVSLGYVYVTNYSDWLGYVYPNTGPIPNIQ